MQTHTHAIAQVRSIEIINQAAWLKAKRIYAHISSNINTINIYITCDAATAI